METDKKNKGLADNQEGEFILNESGTSVSIDADEEITDPQSSDIKEDDSELKDEESK